MSSCLDEALHHCVMGIWNMGCKNLDSSSRKQLATQSSCQAYYFVRCSIDMGSEGGTVCGNGQSLFVVALEGGWEEAGKAGKEPYRTST